MDDDGRPDADDKSTIHPYQWIEARRGEGGEPYAGLTTSWDSARHDIHLPTRRTGRLICRLTTDAPLVIGASQKPASGEYKSAEVVPYRSPLPHMPSDVDDGTAMRIAVPGSSLKGLLTSTAEAISGSALRVLEDTLLTVRSGPGEALEGLGRLRRKSGEGGFEIVEFEESAVESEANKVKSRTNEDESCKATERNLQKWGETWFATSDKAVSENAPGRPPSLVRNKQGTLGTYYSIRTRQNEHNLGKFAMFATFVPDPASDEGRACHAVSDDAVDTFIALLLERAEREGDKLKQYKTSELHLPRGYRPGFLDAFDKASKAEDDPSRVACIRDWLDGKLVRFEKPADGEDVSVIAFSAIWRARFAAATVHRMFDPSLLPWGSEGRRAGEREPGGVLSPAEALFGVVEDGPRRTESEREAARLLAGRVRVSDALAVESVVLLDEVTLRPLSSPKPPSERMYVKRNVPSGTTPRALGRKRYVPQVERPNVGTLPDGKDKDKLKNQCLRCCPVPPGTVFHFHVDVQNLSEAELGLVLVALEPPLCRDAGERPEGEPRPFRHTLGLGKPIGLGAVSIEVLEFRERETSAPLSAARLSAPFYAHRHAVRGRAAPTDDPRYPVDDEVEGGDLVPPGSGIEPGVPRGQLGALIDPGLMRRLRTIGCPPGNDEGPVWYPLEKDNENKGGGVSIYTEGFRWFTNSETRNRSSGKSDGGEEFSLENGDDKELSALAVVQASDRKGK